MPKGLLRLLTFCLLGVCLFAGTRGRDTRMVFQLPLRSRVEVFKGTNDWHQVRIRQEFSIAETALLICDMWDNHWCTAAAQRVNALVRKMAPIVDQSRNAGIVIIHAPSEVMEYYKDYPQRKEILAIPKLPPPVGLDLRDPPLPIDDTQGGCETPGAKFFKAWTKEHDSIRIQPEDVISDNGTEIYSFLRSKRIQNLLVMGVHTNMCILNRPFGIKQMTRWGIHCILVRDLTDAMYDPNYRPFVNHARGTELVVEHIEKYWCPSTLSNELSEALRHVRRSSGGGTFSPKKIDRRAQ